MPLASALICIAIIPLIISKTVLSGTSRIVPVFDAQTYAAVAANWDIHPSCRFTPSSSSGVTVAMKLISDEGLNFTISSGRYSIVAGSNNVAKGVTIDFNTRMCSVNLNEKAGMVRVQPGAKRSDVYHFVEGRGWIVVSGRLSELESVDSSSEVESHITVPERDGDQIML
ncbi:hypothetical protein BT63DRAFT_410725 [Microthyrium microscopicum]|uniref:FAD linked oxidase N-terminal domain-containing protein n=1 Tax=Microthyrium microscopicum TaxID=703497 RepID=A0A6A6UQP7_9PEZI|nr:hypothetical protein BT63DRAFT_410725 [Microthyrium microscopicum]